MSPDVLVLLKTAKSLAPLVVVPIFHTFKLILVAYLQKS